MTTLMIKPIFNCILRSDSFVFPLFVLLKKEKYILCYIMDPKNSESIEPGAIICSRLNLHIKGLFMLNPFSIPISWEYHYVPFFHYNLCKSSDPGARTLWHEFLFVQVWMWLLNDDSCYLYLHSHYLFLDFFFYFSKIAACMKHWAFNVRVHKPSDLCFYKSKYTYHSQWLCIGITTEFLLRFLDK